MTHWRLLLGKKRKQIERRSTDVGCGRKRHPTDKLFLNFQRWKPELRRSNRYRNVAFGPILDNPELFDFPFFAAETARPALPGYFPVWTKMY